MLGFMNSQSISVYLEPLTPARRPWMNSKMFLAVGLVALGVRNLRLALGGFKKEPEFATLGQDSISRDLAKPRTNRYLFSLSLFMILVGAFGLILGVAEIYHNR
jgi:hypothetical protein